MEGDALSLCAGTSVTTSRAKTWEFSICSAGGEPWGAGTPRIREAQPELQMLQSGAGSELARHKGGIYYCITHLYIKNKIVLHNQSSFVIYCFLSLHRCGCFSLSPGGQSPWFSCWGCGRCCGMGGELRAGGRGWVEVFPKETNIFCLFVPKKLQELLQRVSSGAMACPGR